MYKSLGFLLLGYVAAVQSETFDYLIAGAGTAGFVIANRLSSDPNVTVAVIEPGDDVRQDPDVQTINFSFTTFNTSINWQYPSVTSPALGSRNLTYRAGKAWGGTSAVNGMVFIRGDKAQYDAWEQLGNQGWNWDSIFSYAKRGEDFSAPTTAQVASGASFDPNAHGTSGPLDVGFPFSLSNSSFYQKARDTWQSLGLEPISEVNGGNTHGFVTAPMTVDRDADVREDSTRAYYTPVEARKNLKIIKGTVKRITWADSKGGKALANGFEYVSPSGELVQVGARKEVVLSASAYRNPLILEGSGVGNPIILKKLGINVTVDLPGVGESMQDHNSVGMTYSQNGTIGAGRTPFATMPTVYDVFGNKTSSIAASTSKKIGEWAKNASAITGGALSPSAIETRFRTQHDLIFKKNVSIAEIFPTNTGTSILAQFWTTMPFSWGSVHLTSRDAFNEPAITPNLLSIDFDLEILTAVGRLNQKAYATPPLSDLISDNVSPGFSTLPLNATDDQWATYLKGNVLNALHTVGSCSMLPRELGGVVDDHVKVHGTQNVRVVDASAIPMALSGHPTGPIYAFAEKAADLIREG